ncbi:MAG: hypothetical protein IKX53_01850 [Bacteroidales bacterium]|nr:hypothetical protein [Bacteroidales bacterium]
MINLPGDFSLESIKDETQATFTPLYNYTRLSSTDGQMVFTADKIYYVIGNPGVRMTVSDWCLDISEIASYGKQGLGGYKIVLADGTKLLFSNVFRKMREGITAAIEARLNK